MWCTSWAKGLEAYAREHLGQYRNIDTYDPITIPVPTASLKSPSDTLYCPAYPTHLSLGTQARKPTQVCLTCSASERCHTKKNDIGFCRIQVILMVFFTLIFSLEIDISTRLNVSMLPWHWALTLNSGNLQSRMESHKLTLYFLLLL